jgi:hypothetical protein
MDSFPGNPLLRDFLMRAKRVIRGDASIYSTDLASFIRIIRTRNSLLLYVQ